MSTATLQGLAVACEVTGTLWSRGAMAHAERVLADYSEPDVLAALELCVREISGQLSLAKIIERIHERDGRPSTERAWFIALQAMDNQKTIIWNSEIAEAWRVALDTYLDGNKIGARIAFVAEYERIIKTARAERRAVRWLPSIGFDVAQREAVVREGVATGLLLPATAAALGVEVDTVPALAAPGPAALAQSVAQSLTTRAKP